MTSESQKKRKGRLVRAVVIALLLGSALWTAAILAIYVFEDALPPIEPRIELIKSAVICTRCGAVGMNKMVTIDFGLDMSQPREGDFTPIAPSFMGPNNCDHKDVREKVGMRARIFSIYPSEWRSFKSGYLDNDFFSTAPALKAALSSIAETNSVAAQKLLSGVILLRMRLTSAAILVPALQSTNVELLKSQLLSANLSKDAVAAEAARLWSERPKSFNIQR